MQWKSTERLRTLIHRMITKQRVKTEQIKRNQTCFLCFVNVFEFQENKFKIVQKNFYKIKRIFKRFIKIYKRFLGKATGHNDHYMINMGSQRPMIDGNWPLTVTDGPYLQHWLGHTIFNSWKFRQFVVNCCKLLCLLSNFWTIHREYFLFNSDSS